jgi:hypothetical protein
LKRTLSFSRLSLRIKLDIIIKTTQEINMTITKNIVINSVV